MGRKRNQQHKQQHAEEEEEAHAVGVVDAATVELQAADEAAPAEQAAASSSPQLNSPTASSQQLKSPLAVPPSPANLPAPPCSFVGEDEETRSLTDAEEAAGVTTRSAGDETPPLRHIEEIVTCDNSARSTPARMRLSELSRSSSSATSHAGDANSNDHFFNFVVSIGTLVLTLVVMVMAWLRKQECVASWQKRALAWVSSMREKYAENISLAQTRAEFFAEVHKEQINHAKDKATEVQTVLNKQPMYVRVRDFTLRAVEQIMQNSRQ